MSAEHRFKVKMLEPVVMASQFGGSAVVYRAQPEVQNPDAKPPILFRGGVGRPGRDLDYIKQLAGRYGREAFAVRFQGDRVLDKDFISVTYTDEGKAEVHNHAGGERKALLGAYLRDEVDLLVSRQIMKEAATVGGVCKEIYPNTRPDAIFQSQDAASGLLTIAGPVIEGEQSPLENVVFTHASMLGNTPPPAWFLLGVLREGSRRPFSNLIRGERFDHFEGAGALLVDGMDVADNRPYTMASANGIIYGSFSPLLHQVRSGDPENRPNVSWVIGHNDRLFAAEKLIPSLLSPQDVDRIVIVPGGHGIGRRTQVLDQIVDLLNPETIDLSLPLQDRLVWPPHLMNPLRRRWLRNAAAVVDSRAVQT